MSTEKSPTQSNSPIGSRTSVADWSPATSSSAPAGTTRYNKKLAQTAENNGFEYALSQVRYEASYGAEYQHESTSFSLAVARHGSGSRSSRRPSGTVAAGRSRQARCDGGPSVRWAHRRERREWLVQGRIHSPRRAQARTRRAVPAQRRIPPGAAQDLDRGRRRLPRRLLPDHDFTLKPNAEHAGAAQSRTVPGRQFDCSAGERGTLTPTGTSATVRISTASPSNSTTFDASLANMIARSSSASTDFIIARDTEKERRTLCGKSSTRRTAPRSKASEMLCSKRVRRRPTARGCGRTRRSTISCSTTTDSAVS